MVDVVLRILVTIGCVVLIAAVTKKDGWAKWNK